MNNNNLYPVEPKLNTQKVYLNIISCTFSEQFYLNKFSKMALIFKSEIPRKSPM